MIAIAIAIAVGDVVATTLIDLAQSATDVTIIEFGTCSIVSGGVWVVIASRGIGASKDQTRQEVACAVVQGGAFVEVASLFNRATQNLVVVTDAIAVSVLQAVASAHTDGVKLTSIAVTVACGNIVAPAFIDCSEAVANTASIVRADAIVHVVTNAISIKVGRTNASAVSERVLKRAGAVVLTSIGVKIACASVCATWKHAGSIVDERFGIVVASSLVRAALAAQVFAASVVRNGLLFVVAGSHIEASHARQIITTPILNAGFSRVVAGGFICAPGASSTGVAKILIKPHVDRINVEFDCGNLSG